MSGATNKTTEWRVRPIMRALEPEVVEVIWKAVEPLLPSPTVVLSATPESRSEGVVVSGLSRSPVSPLSRSCEVGVSVAGIHQFGSLSG